MALSDQTILNYIATNPRARREGIRRHAAPSMSETTVRRALKRLVEENKLELTGRGPATRYSLAGSAVVRSYLETSYNRRKPTSYSIDRTAPGSTRPRSLAKYPRSYSKKLTSQIWSSTLPPTITGNRTVPASARFSNLNSAISYDCSRLVSLYGGLVCQSSYSIRPRFRRVWCVT